jgi:hypothetical protein
MSFLTFLNHWWNLPFLVMLGLVGVFFLLQVAGIFGHDADTDADGDVDADHDADGVHDAGGMSAPWHEVLTFLGVGRVPFMVVWVTLFLFGGFSGIFANRVLFVRSGGDYAGWWFALVMLFALVIGLIGVHFFSRLAAKFVDVGGKGAVSKHELAGKLGVVASATIDGRFGEIRVHDDRNNELLVHGCLKDSEPPLPRGARVVLVDFDGEKELFWATACPEAPEEKK